MRMSVCVCMYVCSYIVDMIYVYYHIDDVGNYERENQPPTA